MWYEITPTSSNETQKLRNILQSYGNQRIRVLPDGNQIMKPNMFPTVCPTTGLSTS